MAKIMTIKTAKTDPDHWCIGRYVKAWDGHIYLCDSHDSRWGFWMTRIDTPVKHEQDQSTEWRKNVSENAINRTFHVISEDEYGMSCRFGYLRESEIEFIKKHSANENL